jgi:hypothetical protein
MKKTDEEGEVVISQHEGSIAAEEKIIGSPKTPRTPKVKV